jgi:phage/plasmid-associated DNA primase
VWRTQRDIELGAGWLATTCAEGKLSAPGTGELNEELASNASAVKAFVAECCELAPDAQVTIDAVYSAYRVWCEGVGARAWADRLPINQFSGKLRSAYHGQVQVVRPRSGGTRKRMFAGLRLRKDR